MRYTIDMAPKPQSRPRFGNGRTYEKSDMTSWKRELASILKSNKPKLIENGPVYIGSTFYIRPPKRISKVDTKRPVANEQIEKIFVDKRSDLDNYIKALLDASNGILFKDDGQVSVISAQKLYSLNPRIELEVLEL